MTDSKSLALKNIIRKNIDLIEKTARRYTGRGADFEDLQQEACLALIHLVQKRPLESCNDIGEYLRKRLPGRVRDAARRHRYEEHNCALTEAHEVSIPAPTKHLPVDLIDLIERNFSKLDCFIIRHLFYGYTQKEISKKINRTQQCVHYRIKKIRKRLDELLRRYEF